MARRNLNRKKLLRKTKVFRAKSKINKILKTGKQEGYDQVTSFLRKRDKKRKGLVPPDVLRAKHAEEQISLKKDIDGLTIHAHTNFIPRFKDFSNHGTISVIIEETNSSTGKRLYGSYFYKVGNFADDVSNELRFLNNRLQLRPEYRGKLAELYRESKKHFYQWVWRNKSGDIIKEKDFYENLPQELIGYVYARKEQQWYYHNVVRDRKKIKGDISNIKKPWKREVTVDNPLLVA